MLAPTIALLALAAPVQQDNESPFILDAYFAGFEALLAHPKDRGIARLAEHLPGAMRASIDPQHEDSRLGVTFLEQLLTIPIRLRMAPREDPSMVMLLPFDAQLELHGIDAADARELLAGLEAAFETDTGAPEPTVVEPGLLNRTAEGISMTYGVKDGHGVMAYGPLRPPGVPSTLLGPSARPHIAASFDPELILKTITNGMFLFGGGSGIELPNWYYALFGGLEVDAVWGRVGDEGVGVLHLTEMGRVAEELGILTDATIEPSSLARVPEDAAFAKLWAISPSGLFDAASLLLTDAMDAEDIAVHADKLAALAEAWFGEQGGLWLANSTGGLDGLAFVAFQELAPDATPEAIFKWVTGSLPEGARATRWSVAGTQYLSITAPGFPLPIEPTLAVQDGALWFALQPGNLAAALASTTSLGSRVSVNEGSVAWAFLDTPALASRGATWASMLCSSGANYLRQFVSIEAGNWMAPMPELLEGARPAVLHVTRRGNDLHADLRADPSLSVNVAGALGLLDRQLPLLGALGLGVYLERGNVLGTAKVARANQLQVRADLKAIEMAIVNFTLRNGEAPESLELLVIPDENGYRYLRKAGLPRDPWGHLYRYGRDGRNATGFTLYSLGRDGTPGGEGENTDWFHDEVEEIFGTIENATEEAVDQELSANQRKAIADLWTIDTAVTNYTLRNGQAPDDFEALITPDVNGHRFLNVTEVPKDPWGRPYHYASPVGDRGYHIYTLGRDGAPGGKGEDKDLDNWSLPGEDPDDGPVVLRTTPRRGNPAPPEFEDPPADPVERFGPLPKAPPAPPQRITAATPDEDVDPGEIDLASIPPLEKDPYTTDEEWAEIVALAAIMADPERPRDAWNAARELHRIGRPAYPAMVNVMLPLDLESHDGHLQGDYLQKELERLLGGRNFGWKHDFATEPNKTALFNKKVVRKYHKVWSRIRGDHAEWCRLANIDWAPMPEPVEVDPRTLSPLERARRQKALADLQVIEGALLHYTLNNGGSFPGDLRVLVARDVNGEAYLDLPEVPVDPWGAAYLYAPPVDDHPYRIFTLGADQEVGGSGTDADITHETE